MTRAETWAAMRRPSCWATAGAKSAYLVRYWRFLIFRLRNPHVVTEGFVFLGRCTEVYARKGYGRLVLGRWTHFGDRTALRCHEGNMRVGEKAVLGQDISVNCYLDVEIGACSLVADHVYVADFDHRTDDLTVPIKDQGIHKRPVRIGPDVWLGSKATVLRGVHVGRGSVVGANSVVTKDVPAYAIAVGVPAKVVRSRLPEQARPELDLVRPEPLAALTRRGRDRR